jgi:hypothetical protein
MEPAAVVSREPVAVVSREPVAVALVKRTAVALMAPAGAVSMVPDAVAPIAVVSMAPAGAVWMVPDAVAPAAALDRAWCQVSREVSPEASRGAGELQRFLADYKDCCPDARPVAVDVFQVRLAPVGLAPVFQVDASAAALPADIRPGQTIRPHDSLTKILDGIQVHTPASSPPNRIPNGT